jgi:tetratricopeptide (TPR) repeat protein
MRASSVHAAAGVGGSPSTVCDSITASGQTKCPSGRQSYPSTQDHDRMIRAYREGPTTIKNGAREVHQSPESAHPTDGQPVRPARSDSSFALPAVASTTSAKEPDRAPKLTDANSKAQLRLAALKTNTPPRRQQTDQTSLQSGLQSERRRDIWQLERAVDILRKALAAAEQDGQPGQLAIARNNLGYMLGQLGAATGNQAMLNSAIALCRRGLSAVDRDEMPRHWAVLQQSLAFGLLSLGLERQEVAHIAEAVERFDAALAVFEEVAFEGYAALITERLEQSVAALLRLSPSLSDLAETNQPVNPYGDRAETTEDDGTSAEEIEADGDDEVDEAHGVAEEDAEEEDAANVFEMSLSGYVQFSVLAGNEELLSEGDDPVEFLTESEADIYAKYRTDQGVEYSSLVTLDIDPDDIDNASTAALYISGGFGEVRLGRDSGAEDDMAIDGAYYQAGTGGIDGDTANTLDVSLEDSGSAAKVSYFTPRLAGVQAGLSFTPDTADTEGDIDEDEEDELENHFGAGLNWVKETATSETIVSAVTSVGESSTEDDDLLSFSLGAGVEFENFGFGAGYTIETEANDQQLFNVGAGYSFDPPIDALDEASLSAGIALALPDDESESMLFALSGDLGLLPGVALLGDVTYNTRDPLSDSGDSSTISAVLAIELYY